MAIEVFPVIHINSTEQAVDQAALAFDARADGVFLIDHHNHDERLLMDTFDAVKRAEPRNFVGLNFLQHRSGADSLEFLLDSFRHNRTTHKPDGLWMDDAHADKNRLKDLRDRHPILSSISYLGGTAFKYTAFYTEDPVKAAAEADRLKAHVDIVTTSGSGTGTPPSPEKIKAMKQAIGEQKLAVASGISHDNIESYDGSFDKLLVSSSIETEKYSGIFVPKKLIALIELAHSIETS